MKKEEILSYHKGGKIEVNIKKPLNNQRQLSISYTPGVADVALEIKKDASKVFDYTIKSNTVAIVTDGSRVLGLGNIGAKAAIPIMEGKAMLFKKLGDVDAFPICINTQRSDEFISIVKNISPIFGGINLEDIEAPKCFEIEETLSNELDIPVFHDDQYGTATVVLAALINACKVVNKRFSDVKIVINGAGAAGLSIAKLLACIDINKKICEPVAEIIVCDTRGALYKDRSDMNKYKSKIAELTNKHMHKGPLDSAIKDADVFIGVSTGNIIKKHHIESMAKNPIIFACANPVPEIEPDDAIKFGAAIVGTGRSNYKNQINNVLAFPGIFRGALDAKAKRITKEMVLSAACAIADYIKNPTKDKIVPDPLDKKLHMRVAKVIKQTALSHK
ncbi:MAG: NADP-dependent malic enzyme [Nanoarchaeota archaeon]